MMIGKRLRELREAKQLSQGDIEKRTGLLRCYICNRERVSITGFADSIGGLGFHNSRQTFFVSPNPPGSPGPTYPAFVREPNGKDYGTLGIWIQNAQVFVNGSKGTKPCD